LGASREETLRRRAAMQSISEAVALKDDDTNAIASPAVQRKATDVVLVDLKYRESACKWFIFN
jgi:hypothetical protein